MKVCARLVALLCFLATAGTAYGEGFALYEYGARGIALGGAAMARGNPDPATVAYNPALLTKLTGTRVQAGITAILPRGKMEWNDAAGRNGTTSLKDLNWYMPHAYFTQQLNDDWFFGVGEFTRYGLGFEYPSNWPGRFNIYEVNLLTASINPNIAWKATEKLSLAAGVEIMYVTLDLRRRGAANPAAPAQTEFDINIKDANAWGVGGNFAFHYQFSDQWAIGAQYRSKVRVHAFGDASFQPVGERMSKDILNGNGITDGTAHAAVVFPDSVAGGISFTPIPELSFEAGAVWTRWSTFRSLNISFNNRLGQARSFKHWGDAMRWNFGVEWEALDWLTLRGGFVYDESPMREGWEDYLVPTNDRYIWSAGLGFHWDNWTVDLSAAFIDALGRRYSANRETNVMHSRAKASDTYIYSLSVGYKF